MVTILWLAPVAGFWTWHLLASQGIYFSQEFHGQVFRLYADALGLDPAAVTQLLERALVTDGLVVAAILMFRRRYAIAAFIRFLRFQTSTNDRARPAG